MVIFFSFYGVNGYDEFIEEWFNRIYIMVINRYREEVIIFIFNYDDMVNMVNGYYFCQDTFNC